MTTLPLSEVFGPTFQGEGPHAGRRCAFVRLGRCNLTCEWCDTPFTWDRTRYDLSVTCPDTEIAEVHNRLRAIDANMVVLSGGEPLLHTSKLPELLSSPWEWHAETNGTIAPPDWWELYVAHTTVSPKINTRDPEHRRLRPKALEAWADGARRGWVAWKFVVTELVDLEVVAKLVADYEVPARAVWVMPEGTRAVTVINRHRRLAQGILDSGFNTTTRLHTLLWNDERAR